MPPFILQGFTLKQMNIVLLFFNFEDERERHKASLFPSTASNFSCRLGVVFLPGRSDSDVLLAMRPVIGEV